MNETRFRIIADGEYVYFDAGELNEYLDDYTYENVEEDSLQEYKDGTWKFRKDLRYTTIKCKNCGKEFTMLPSDILRYKDKGFSLPTQCNTYRSE